MPRWLLWTPLLALTAAFAVLGWRAGWHVSGLTETDVIEAAAARYVAGGEGRSRTDCAAQPHGSAQIWITVTCTEATGRSHRYDADRFGTLRTAPVQTAPET